MNRREFTKGLAALSLGAVVLPAAAGETRKEFNMPIKVAKGRVAVIYFSRTGNTRYAAGKIAEYCGGAKVFEVKSEKPYAPDYSACCDEAQPECRGKLDRAFEPLTVDWSAYDVVLFGTPNWWGTMAPPLRTFAKTNLAALKGKTVGIFQTHGGGGMQRVGADFVELVGDKATVLPSEAWFGTTIKLGIGLKSYVTERLTIA